MTIPKTVPAFIVIKDGSHRYYLLKVVRRGFDVYCIPPHLGIHYSVHESGQAHFRVEGKAQAQSEQPPVLLMDGEAGTPIGNGIIRAPLGDLGRASGICTAIYPIDSLSGDFRRFHRNPQELFVIDKGLFPQGTSWIEIGVWAVPKRNEVSFEFNVPNIPADLLYKVAQADPQIWIYARPFGSASQVNGATSGRTISSKRPLNAKGEIEIQNRPTHGIQSRNRIQYETTAEGRNIFREYWIHEWDRRGYDAHEHIADLDQAIRRARELGYSRDAEKLERLFL